jgi:hypothetical protein
MGWSHTADPSVRIRLAKKRRLCGDGEQRIRDVE